MSEARTFTFPVVAQSATALESAIAAIAPGGYADFAIPTFDQSWDTGGNYVSWSTRFHWHGPNKSAHWFGKPVSLGQLRYVFYDAASNTFTQRYLGHPTAQQTGHNYDHSFVDSDGVAYWRPSYATTVYRWNGSAWEAALTHTNSEEVVSHTWHPNLYGAGQGGVVIAGQLGSLSRIFVWRKGDAAATGPIGVGTVTGLTYNTSAMYSPALDAVLVFGPTGNTCFKITPGPVVTQVGNTTAPVGFKQLTRWDCPVAAPNGDALILECAASSRRVWRLVNDVWVEQAYTHPLVNFDGFNGLSASTDNVSLKCATIPGQAVWAFGNNLDGSVATRLWRPA